MSDLLRKLESEKTKLSEKWIRLSAKNKQEDKKMGKMKELEMQNDLTYKEIHNMNDKMERLERENLYLKK